MEATSRERFNNSTFWLEFGVFSDGLEHPSPSPSSSSSSSAPIFHKFPDLPPELRLKIWSHLIQPRIVVACCLERNPLTLPARRAELAFRSRCPPTPVLLHVNRESRSLALGHYEPAFGWRISALLSDNPVERPPRVWFNFELDALYLAGELEAYDSYGFNSPMVYFLRREDTRRVRHVAAPFRELHYPEQESNQIFGCLWHVVDRFQGAERLLLTVSPGDEETVRAAGGGSSIGSLISADNIIQKIWNGWICGTTVTSESLANKQMVMLREEDLAQFVASA